jgi:predicted dehydrogenase
VAPNHVDAVLHASGVHLRWVCDVDRAKAEEMAALAGGAKVTTDASVALADPELHAVSICVGHGDHAALIRAALLAGKHVMVEKPFTLSVSEAEELVSLAEARQLRLAVVSQHRFDPIVRAVKGCLDAGLLGRLLLLSARLECLRTPDYFASSPWRGTWRGEGGSCTANQGYHYVDALCFLAGPVAEVRSLAGTLVHTSVIETEDTLVAALRHAAGPFSTLAVTLGSSVTWRSQLALVGTAGSVEFAMDFPNTLISVEGSDELRGALARASQVSRDERPPGVAYYGISHRDQLADFFGAVRGPSRLAFDGNDALVTLRALAAIYGAAGHAWRD